MPGLLRTSQAGPFTLNNTNNAMNFMESYRPNFHSNLRYPGDFGDPEEDNLEEEELDEDEDDEDEENDDEGVMHNQELSELLDRILYGQQRPLDIPREGRDYTTSRIQPNSTRIRAREPFIRFGEDDSIEDNVVANNTTVIDEQNTHE